MTYFQTEDELVAERQELKKKLAKLDAKIRKIRGDKPYIFNITPKIDMYLEFKGHGRFKAQVVRKAIEDRMGKDEEYQKYLKAFS